MHRYLAKLLAAGLLAAACASPAPSPVPTSTQSASPADFEIEADQFTDTGGCGDAFIWATNRAGTAAITVQWGGAASEAWAAGAFQATHQLPDPEITVSVVEGSGLAQYYCNDVRGPGQRETSTIDASHGTVELVVRPDRQGFQPAGHADLRLSDVTFDLTLGSGEAWRLEELVIENVSVGWFAG